MALDADLACDAACFTFLSSSRSSSTRACSFSTWASGSSGGVSRDATVEKVLSTAAAVVRTPSMRDRVCLTVCVDAHVCLIEKPSKVRARTRPICRPGEHVHDVMHSTCDPGYVPASKAKGHPSHFKWPRARGPGPRGRPRGTSNPYWSSHFAHVRMKCSLFCFGPLNLNWEEKINSQQPAMSAMRARAL